LAPLTRPAIGTIEMPLKLHDAMADSRGVHHQVMVAGIGLLDTGGRYTHVDQAKAHGQPTRCLD
jgi:hypothetical protein